MSWGLIMGSRDSSTQLSVLMPAFKASRTIGMAILSSLLVMPRNSELLIHLDGPGTSSRILEWAARHKRVRVLASKSAIGISSALNNMISESKGELIARMDADDISLPFRFGRAIRLVRSGKADLVFLNAILFGYGRAFPFIIPQLPFPMSHRVSELMLGLANPFVHPTLVARKAAIIQAGGYHPCVAEDYDLWMRAVMAGLKLRRITQYGVLYRVHKDQYTQQANFEQKQAADPMFQATRIAYRSYLSNELTTNDSGIPVIEKLDGQLKAMSFGYRVRNGIFKGLIEGSINRLSAYNLAGSKSYTQKDCARSDK